MSKTVNLASIPYINGEAQMTKEELNHRLNRYLQELSSSDRQTPAHNSILGFFSLVQNAIRSREVSEKVPEGKQLLVLANDPPEEIDSEAITFYLRSRAPGQWNRGASGEARIREVSAHVRAIEPHPEHLGEKLVTMGKTYDNYVVFNIYARDDYAALSRVLWFEKVMDSFRWYFKVHGINNIIEEGVGDKQNVMVGQLHLTKYPLTYFVRTEDIYHFGSQELKHIELNINLSTRN